jgi:ABC-type spermidine/putrescine transport system permease subunit I
MATLFLFVTFSTYFMIKLYNINNIIGSNVYINNVFRSDEFDVHDEPLDFDYNKLSST